MKTIFVRDITNGMTIDSETFAVQEVRKAMDRNDKPYYDLVLIDKTGSLKCKIWNDNIVNVDESALAPGKIVSISGRIDQFKGNVQLNIQKLVGVDETKVDDYLEASAFDPDEMWNELMGLVEGLQNESLKQLMHNMLADEELARGLKYHPAGVYIHHGFRSGMMQHILEIISVCHSLKRFYENVNFDLVTVGAILHDMGKLKELKIQGAATTFTTEGVMVGHIVMSYEMMMKHVPADMDQNLLLKLRNMILSHHGEKEKGSPVLPVTIEAVLLSAADDLIFKIGSYNRIIKGSGAGEGDFSEYDNVMGLRVYTGQ